MPNLHEIVFSSSDKAASRRIQNLTVYRTDYLGAIRRLTRKNEPKIYIQMLERAYEFSSTVHNEDIDEVERSLRKCNVLNREKKIFCGFELNLDAL